LCKTKKVSKVLPSLVNYIKGEVNKKKSNVKLQNNQEKYMTEVFMQHQYLIEVIGVNVIAMLFR
jgi:hypothetical protein